MNKIAINASLFLVSEKGTQIEFFNESDLLVISLTGSSFSRISLKKLIDAKKIINRLTFLAHPISFRMKDREFFQINNGKGQIKNYGIFLKILIQSIF
ncbi:MAG: hypothetical protein AAF843_06460 [Bacteroidota bacterium]